MDGDATGTMGFRDQAPLTRINPVDPNNPQANAGYLITEPCWSESPAGARSVFPPSQVLDGGSQSTVPFYGIRKPDDPLIEATVKVIDAALRHDFPAGPCFRRYSHDGYGQEDDGGAFTTSGRDDPGRR